MEEPGRQSGLFGACRGRTPPRLTLGRYCEAAGDAGAALAAAEAAADGALLAATDAAADATGATEADVLAAGAVVALLEQAAATPLTRSRRIARVLFMPYLVV